MHPNALFHPPVKPATPIEALITGLLALMTAYQSNPCHHLAHKIAINLRELSTHPSLSDHFRLICHRLQNQWGAICDGACLPLQIECIESSTLH